MISSDPYFLPTNCNWVHQMNQEVLPSLATTAALGTLAIGKTLVPSVFSSSWTRPLATWLSFGAQALSYGFFLNHAFRSADRTAFLSCWFATIGCSAISKDLKNYIFAKEGKLAPEQAKPEDLRPQFLAEHKKAVFLEEKMKEKIKGQASAIESVCRELKRHAAGLKNERKPIGSFLFLGDPGVGKTHLAQVIAEETFGQSEAFIQLNMSEYGEKFSVSRLIGPPPGYVGHEDGGQLTEKVRKNPYSVVLLDEIDKAHPDVLNIFLQILEEGYAEDGLGRKVDFSNTLIIMTSNKEAFHKDANGKWRPLHIRPELLDRLDDCIEFNPLDWETLCEVFALQMQRLQNKLSHRGIFVQVTDEVRDFIILEGLRDRQGARPLKRAIQHHIENLLAEAILNETPKPGTVYTLSFNEQYLTLTSDPPI